MEWKERGREEEGGRELVLWEGERGIERESGMERERERGIEERRKEGK